LSSESKTSVWKGARKKTERKRNWGPKRTKELKGLESPALIRRARFLGEKRGSISPYLRKARNSEELKKQRKKGGTRKPKREEKNTSYAL